MRPGHLIGGKYRLERWLGGGGMGHVWRARHVELGSPVAVKLLVGSQRDPWALQRFKREARVAAGLKSPHVVDVRDCGVDRGVPYIVMELLEGESLASRLSRAPGVTLGELSRWVCQAGLALQLAHERDLVHRDIKPSNLFLVSQGGTSSLKLLDFGIVKSLTEAKAGESTLVGSPAYLSPEQARGEAIDHTTDLWALGAVIYRVATGVEPFSAPSLAEVIERVCVRPVQAPSRVHPELPERFDRFMERALSRERSRRFRSASELAAALSEIASADEGLVLPSAPADSSAELAPRGESTRSWSAPSRPPSHAARWYPVLGAAVASAMLATLVDAAREPARGSQVAAIPSRPSAQPERAPVSSASPVPSASPPAWVGAPAASPPPAASSIAKVHPKARSRPPPTETGPVSDPIFGLPFEDLEHGQAHSNHVGAGAVRGH